jgi:galactokinase
VENGRGFGHTAADFGVGTQGGSQDHLAILCCRAGQVTQARFLPSQVEREVAWPADWSLVVAASGVHAAKSAGTREHYNTLSRQAETLLTLARATSLLDVLTTDPAATAQLEGALGRRRDATALGSRLAQFREECLELIPGAVAAIAAGDAVTLGDRITRSATLGAMALGNQVPETLYLAESAPALGAVAASPFGAGFGGSVYALVPSAEGGRFATHWAAGYRERFPAAARHAEFFVTTPSAGAHEVT